MRYRVYGHTTVVVTTEVNAESPEEALEKAGEKLDSLIPYGGNGGTDKLIGLDGDCDTVAADESIEWDDCEVIDPEDYDDEDDE